MSYPKRRTVVLPLTVILAACVALPASASTAPSAESRSAATDLAAAKSASRWLRSQLDARGTYPNPWNSDMVDGGLMIDAVYAMHAAGTPQNATPILTYLDDEQHAADYYTDRVYDFDCNGDGTPDGDKYYHGGQAAKTLLAAVVSGRDPRNFGGRNLLAETTALIDTSPGDKGMLADQYVGVDCSDTRIVNTFGQALGVIAYAGLHDAHVSDMANTLVKNQCAGGYFRLYFGGRDGAVESCKEYPGEPGTWPGTAPDGDSTGFALSAMVAARDAGVAGLDDEITEAANWLVANQDPASGGWAGGQWTPDPNTNSTGLIVTGLEEAGLGLAAAKRGRAFIASVQITKARDGGTPLAGDIGAIAYSPQTYQEAQDAGTGVGGNDQWIRATAQAALGLAGTGWHELAWGRLRLAIRGVPQRGKLLTLVVPKAQKGEQLVVRLDGVVIRRVTSPKSGGFRFTVMIPAKTKPGAHKLTIDGAAASRHAWQPITVR